MEVNRCDGCFYILKIVNAKNLSQVAYSCRRYPPTMTLIAGERGAWQTGSVFPIVQPEWCCGEYRRVKVEGYPEK